MPQKQSESMQQKKPINQNQIARLVELKQVIKDKIQNSITSGMKLRIDDMIEDQSLQLEDEYVEDQIRIICNNTGKSNFKQKIEDLKKFVIKKPIQYDKEGNEIIDKKSSKA